MSIMLKILKWIKEVFKKIFGLREQEEVNFNEIKCLPKHNPIPDKPEAKSVVELKVEEPEKARNGKRAIRLFAMGKALWLVEQKRWTLRDAAKEAGINHSLFSSWRRYLPERLVQARSLFLAHINEHGEPDLGTRISKAQKHLQLVAEVIVFSEENNISIKQAAKEVSIDSTTVYNWMRKRPEECLEAKKALLDSRKGVTTPSKTKPKAKAKAKSKTARSPRPRISLMRIGHAMYLIKVKGMPIHKASLEVRLSNSTISYWKTHRPEQLEEAFELYKASLKEAKAVKKPAYPSMDELNARGEGKLSTKALSVYQSLGEKAGVILAETFVVWEVYLDLILETQCAPSTASGLCRMLMLLDENPSLTTREAADKTKGSYASFFAYGKEGGSKSNYSSKVFSVAKAAVIAKKKPKQKSVSKKVPKVLTKKQVTEVDLVSSWEYAIPALKEDGEARVAKEKAEKARKDKIEVLNPSACWDRLTAACLYQMEGFTTLQACKKAGIALETYNLYKELNVSYKSQTGGEEFFREMALEAESIRQKKSLLKQTVKR
jgi:transposase